MGGEGAGQGSGLSACSQIVDECIIVPYSCFYFIIAVYCASLFVLFDGPIVSYDDCFSIYLAS